MVKVVFIAIAFTILAGCCKKKMCAVAMLPHALVRLPANNTSFDECSFVRRVNSVPVDSFTVSNGLPYPVELYPFRDFGDEQGYAVTFLIKRQGKTDTISNFTCDFERVKVNCQDCGMKTSEEVWAYENFSYRHRGKLHSISDTLKLD
jgi:hypothetical protein